MFIHSLLRTHVSFLAFISAAVTVLCSGASFGQVPDPYKGVDLWTLAYKVTIKTKCEKFCTIKSEETTEGQPDWLINYSIDREFGGAYYLGGPIQGDQMPILSLPEKGDKPLPPTADQLKAVMGDLSNYVGWQHPGPGLAGKEPPVMHAKIKDEFDLTGITKECSKTTYEVYKTANFDRDLIIKYAFANLAFDLVGGRYKVDFNITPANTGDELHMVDVKAVETTKSDDPNDKTNDSKTSNTKERLPEFLLNSEKSIKSPNLVYRSSLPQGADEIRLCKKEEVKGFDFYNPEVTKDVETNKTLVIMFAITIRKGLAPLRPSDACN